MRVWLILFGEMNVCDFEIFRTGFRGPHADSILFGFGLGLKEQGTVLATRPDQKYMGQSLLEQSSIDHLVTDIDIGQDSIVGIPPLLIEFQPDFFAQDKGFIEPFGFQIKGFLKFRRVDPEVANLPTVFKDNGIAIVHSIYPDTFIRSHRPKKDKTRTKNPKEDDPKAFHFSLT